MITRDTEFRDPPEFSVMHANELERAPETAKGQSEGVSPEKGDIDLAVDPVLRKLCELNEPEEIVSGVVNRWASLLEQFRARGIEAGCGPMRSRGF
jgi:hypothetical protein